jgi:hypothetical protein
MTNHVLDGVENPVTEVDSPDVWRDLIKAASDETLENIQRARHNARCTEVSDLRPYENKSFLALIRACDQSLR